jgi:hypothetical protein
MHKGEPYATFDMMQPMLLSSETAGGDTLGDTGDDGLVRAAAEGDRGAFGELGVAHRRRQAAGP